MKIEIKNRFNGSVVFSHECEENSIKITVVEAVKVGANLRDADLYGANLRGANLRGADLCGDKLTKNPLFLLNLQWDIVVTTTLLKIGCQIHPIPDWRSFDDDKISSMAPDALEFWRKNKVAILALCDAHCAE